MSKDKCSLCGEKYATSRRGTILCECNTTIIDIHEDEFSSLLEFEVRAGAKYFQSVVQGDLTLLICSTIKINLEIAKEVVLYHTGKEKIK